MHFIVKEAGLMLTNRAMRRAISVRKHIHRIV